MHNYISEGSVSHINVFGQFSLLEQLILQLMTSSKVTPMGVVMMSYKNSLRIAHIGLFLSSTACTMSDDGEQNDVLELMKSLSSKFDVLQQEVDNLKASSHQASRSGATLVLTSSSENESSSSSSDEDDDSTTRKSWRRKKGRASPRHSSRSRASHRHRSRSRANHRHRSRSRARTSSSRSRAGHQHRSRSRAGASHCSQNKAGAGKRARSRSWAGRMTSSASSDEVDFNESIRFDGTDSEDQRGSQKDSSTKLVEVSKETKKLLTSKCTRRVKNAERLQTRSHYPLPKVPATRTPQLDSYLKSEISQGTKAGDKDLARIQTFVLDALAPLTAILEGANNSQGDLERKHTLDAVTSAVALIGNANAKISHLRREKVTSDLNKALLPIIQEDEKFTKAPPALFGTEFAKTAKEHVDQVKALRSTLGARGSSQGKQPFRKAPPHSHVGGEYRRQAYTHRPGRGGASYQGQRNQGNFNFHKKFKHGERKDSKN